MPTCSVPVNTAFVVTPKVSGTAGQSGQTQNTCLVLTDSNRISFVLSRQG